MTFGVKAALGAKEKSQVTPCLITGAGNIGFGKPEVGNQCFLCGGIPDFVKESEISDLVSYLSVEAMFTPVAYFGQIGAKLLHYGITD